MVQQLKDDADACLRTRNLAKFFRWRGEELIVYRIRIRNRLVIGSATEGGG